MCCVASLRCLSAVKNCLMFCYQQHVYVFVCTPLTLLSAAFSSIVSFLRKCNQSVYCLPPVVMFSVYIVICCDWNKWFYILNCFRCRSIFTNTVFFSVTSEVCREIQNSTHPTPHTSVQNFDFWDYLAYLTRVCDTVVPGKSSHVYRNGGRQNHAFFSSKVEHPPILYYRIHGL